MKENPDAPFIRYLGFLNNEVLVPNSLAAHKSVLYQNCYSFSKPEWFVRLTKEVAGHGLILMEGAEHKAHRKMLTNSFALSNIRKMEPVFKEKAKNICEFFDQRIAANDGKTGTFDCIDTFMKAILDISECRPSKPSLDLSSMCFACFGWHAGSVLLLRYDKLTKFSSGHRRLRCQSGLCQAW